MKQTKNRLFQKNITPKEHFLCVDLITTMAVDAGGSSFRSFWYAAVAAAAVVAATRTTAAAVAAK